MEEAVKDSAAEEIKEEITGQTKCKSCGGIMRYSPSTETLKCIYCGNEEELDKTPIEIKAYDYEEWCNSDNVEAKEETQTVSEVKCQQCGAVTQMPEHVNSAKCPFCGSSLVLDEAKMNRSWKPETILPFKVDDKQGKAAYKKWLSGKWFAPSKLTKNVADASTFQGVYMPYWAYDAKTGTDYTGERGIMRTRIVERDGKKIPETYTDWTYVTGYVDVNFDNVLVPASDTLPHSMSGSLRNWDLENCVAYRKEFVSGFVTELYKKDFVESHDEAKSIMENEIDREIRSDIGGTNQRINSKNTKYDDVKFKLLLLPIWISSFRYNDKVYQFVVNGRNGEVEGNYPKSIPKIILAVVAVIALIYLLYLLTA